MKRILLLLALFFVTSCARAQTWSDAYTFTQTFSGGGSTDFVNTLTLMLTTNTNGGLTWHLPASNGTAHYPLVTDGSGNLSWELLQIAGGGTGNSSYSSGDMLYKSPSSSSALAKLAIGSGGQYLGISGSLPHWQSIDGSEVAHDVLNNPTSSTLGDHNTIQSPDNSTALVLQQSLSGGTAALLMWERADTGAAKNIIDASGNLQIAAFNSGTSASSSTFWRGDGTWATVSSGGVTSFSAGTTGFTPNSATTGAVVLAGTLVVANGGTGATTLTGVVHGNGTSAMTASNVNLTSEVTGALPIANGGTGQTTASAAFNALSPTTTDGDISYRSATTNVRLGAGAAYYPLVIDHVSGRPAWQQLRLDQGVQNILPSVNGGTGIDGSAVTDGQLLIGQTSDNSFGLATIIAGANISVTNAGHSITIANTMSAGMTNPMTTTGDIIYASNTATPATPARLGIGASTTVLHGGTTPSYSQIVNGDITNSTIDLTAKVTGILPAANGGTANGFTAFTGPASSTKTFTLPNASATVLTDNAVVTVAQGGVGVGTLASNGVLYGAGTSAVNALAVNSTGTNKFLRQVSSGAPSWNQVALTTDVTGTLPYGNGGTGATSLTTNAMLYAGASAITATAAPTNGQLLIGSTSAAPALGTLTAGTGITITNAAGAITIAGSTITTTDSLTPQLTIIDGRYAFDTLLTNTSGSAAKRGFTISDPAITSTIPILLTPNNDTNQSTKLTFPITIDSTGRASGSICASVTRGGSNIGMSNNDAIACNVFMPTAQTTSFATCTRTRLSVFAPANSNTTYDTVITDAGATATKTIIVQDERRGACNGSNSVTNIDVMNLTAAPGTGQFTIRFSGVSSSLNISNMKMFVNYGLFTTDASKGVYTGSAGTTGGAAAATFLDTITDANVTHQSTVLATVLQDGNSEAGKNYILSLMDSTTWPAGKFIVRISRNDNGNIASGKGCTVNYVILNKPQSSITLSAGRFGKATLASGTVTVSTTYAHTNSLIFLTEMPTTTNPAHVYVSSISDGASFTITSTGGTDASTVAWMIAQP